MNTYLYEKFSSKNDLTPTLNYSDNKISMTNLF